MDVKFTQVIADTVSRFYAPEYKRNKAMAMLKIKKDVLLLVYQSGPEEKDDAKMYWERVLCHFVVGLEYYYTSNRETYEKRVMAFADKLKIKVTWNNIIHFHGADELSAFGAPLGCALNGYATSKLSFDATVKGLHIQDPPCACSHCYNTITTCHLCDTERLCPLLVDGYHYPKGLSVIFRKLRKDIDDRYQLIAVQHTKKFQKEDQSNTKTDDVKPTTSTNDKENEKKKDDMPSSEERRKSDKSAESDKSVESDKAEEPWILVKKRKASKKNK
jgi:hypothetical protein